MDNMVIHRNLSISTRCKQVITRINKGATSKQMEKEFNRKIETLLVTIRTHHYTGPRGKKFYEQLRQQLKENDLRAASATIQEQKSDDSFTDTSVASTIVEEKPVVTQTQASQEQHDPQETVYLVETSTMLNGDVEKLLDMDEGTSIFYIPRFCLDDLFFRMNHHNDMRAKDALTKLSNKDILGKRVFFMENVSHESSIFDSETTKNFNRRSIAIVDSAVELAMSFHSSDKICVKIITASREVTDLARKVIEDEGLKSILSFALLARKR